MFEANMSDVDMMLHANSQTMVFCLPGIEYWTMPAEHIPVCSGGHLMVSDSVPRLVFFVFFESRKMLGSLLRRHLPFHLA